MTNRTSIPLPTERAVLTKSRRRCCLCLWLEGIDKIQLGQIAHLDHNSSNNKEDNLCFLCLKHHEEYDSTRSQSKGLTKGEVKYWRNELYREMELRFYSLDVDRKLGQAKKAIRKTAHAGLILRAKKTPSRKDAVKWRADAARLIKRFAGDPAKFDFINCIEGAGKIDLTAPQGIRAYLYIHSDHLKELANTIDATDLI